VRRSLTVSLVVVVVVALGALAATLAVGNSPELGLDLQGGASVVLQPPEDVRDEGVLDQAIEIIRNRVDALGVAEPEIARQGDAIIVQLPGVKDQRQALDIVGQTAELRFRPVLSPLPPPGADPAATTTTTTPPASSTTTAPTTTTTAPPAEGESLGAVQLAAARRQASTTTTAPGSTTTTAPGSTTTTAAPAEGVACEPTARADDKAEDEVILLGEAEEGADPPCYRLGPAELLGDAVASAKARIQDVGGEWVVDLTFTDEGSPAFDGVAATCFNAEPTCPTRQLAIVLDGVVQSAPTIQEAEFNGKAQISGGYSEGEAKEAALVLRYGALPVQLEPQTVQTVSASLGRDSLRAGLVAGAIGTAAVLLYMILYYRALGVVVVLGLGVWGALQWSIISYLGASQGLALSLAGTTGIIVSVGVTVDSYVVYFERLKDEVRSGRTLRASVDRSFRRAFRTILAADLAAFIGAAVLYLLTVGPVRGFAFFLGLSTILDIVVAWFFTRPLVALLARRQVFTSARFLGVARGLGTAPPTPATPRPRPVGARP
jgi:preprotein translocase subunit SecD